jgi:hypothetical protein
MGNPYLLPPGLQNSRESLHSLSRTIHGDDDRYKTNYIPNDDTRSYSPSMRRALDDSSSATGSSRHRMRMLEDDMSKNLLKNAQRMSRSMPPSVEVSSPDSPRIQEPDHAYIIDRKDLPKRLERSPNPSLNPSDRSRDGNNDALRNSNMYLGKFIRSGEPSTENLNTSKDQPNSNPPEPEPEKSLPEPAHNSPPLVQSALPGNPRPPRKQSLDAPTLPTLPNVEKNEFIQEHEVSSWRDEYAHNGYETSQPRHDSLYPSEYSQDMPDQRPVSGRFSLDAPNPPVQYDYPDYGYDEQDYQDNPNRRTMGFVPLPPEDPNDTPEERATRIKSFYKEYFDSSKPGPRYNQQYNGQYNQPPNAYYEDYNNYDQEYQYDDGYYDDANGQFVTGQNYYYEEPMTRRAMTPPPRGPSRFRGPPGHMSSGSGGYMPGPRAYSSASYRNGPGPRGPPKRPMPPPQPLKTLPTPHLLRDDTFLPIDFAPPTSIRDKVAGRPGSPLGVLKPYSPTLPSHVPMASSFEELAMMPSP